MEQGAATLARRQMRSLTSLVEWAYFLKTGRTARDYGDHTLLMLQALLFHQEEAGRELSMPSTHWLERPSYRERRKRHRAGPPRRLEAPSKWDEAVITGDPVVDAWERAIARGETPDLGKFGEPVTHA